MASVTFDITYMPTIVNKLGLSVECQIVAAMRQNSAVLTRRARPWRPPSGGIHHATETAVGCWVNNKGDGSPCAALCTASYGGLAALLGAFVEDGSSFAAMSP